MARAWRLRPAASRPVHPASASSKPVKPATTQADMWLRHASSVHTVHSTYSRGFTAPPLLSRAAKSAPRNIMPAENSITGT